LGHKIPWPSHSITTTTASPRTRRCVIPSAMI
jgi:hypothetical protein